MPRFLFLYDQLNGYTTTCLDELTSRPGVDLLVVANRNTLAPFDFRNSRLRIVFRNDMGVKRLARLAKTFAPDVVFISGWAYKDYLTVGLRQRLAGAAVVCMADTKWESRLRQRILAPVAWPLLRSVFSHYWGAGLYQYELARRLHFPQSRVKLGVLACDYRLFDVVYAESLAAKRRVYPHSVLYVGRFSEEKGVRLLYDTWKSMDAEHLLGDWKLVMVGVGPLADHLRPTPTIEVLPFLQPQDLPAVAASAGCFIMPSHRDQWGVAVQEFAAAGLPLVCSSAVGAATAFLRDGYNGFQFNAGDSRSLRKAISDVIACRDERLLEMGARSHALSSQYTPETWADTAVHFVGAATA